MHENDRLIRVTDPNLLAISRADGRASGLAHAVRGGKGRVSGLVGTCYGADEGLESGGLRLNDRLVLHKSSARRVDGLLRGGGSWLRGRWCGDLGR